MICIGYPCDQCEHKRSLIRDGINAVKLPCDAFPNGIPQEFIFDLDPRELPECNNGIGFVERKDNIFRD